MKRISIEMQGKGGTSGNALCIRLHALSTLTEDEVALLTRQSNPVRHHAIRSQLALEGELVTTPRAILSGWAAQVRLLADGRRQIVQLILPGEFIGRIGVRGGYAPVGVIALTDVTLVVLGGLPEVPRESALARALGISTALDEAYLCNQIVRLGRQSAYERTGHLLLELNDRLALAGQCDGDRSILPLTQEVLADVLGLTSVHVNRTLQAMRREGMIELRSGAVEILSRDALAKVADYQRLVVRP